LRAWIESHRASLLDSLRRLGKQPIGSFFTCLVMAVALSMPMGLSLLLKNVERWAVRGSARRRFRCTCNWMPAPRGRGAAREIKGMPGVADAEYVSRDQALEEFQQQSGLGEALRELPENPLPGVVLVTPNEVDKPPWKHCDKNFPSCPRCNRRNLI
jgi:cell division transport system permease protein